MGRRYRRGIFKFQSRAGISDRLWRAGFQNGHCNGRYVDLMYTFRTHVFFGSMDRKSSFKIKTVINKETGNSYRSFYLFLSAKKSNKVLAKK